MEAFAKARAKSASSSKKKSKVPLKVAPTVTVGKKATIPRGAASTDLRVSAGTSHAANAAGNLDTVSEEVTAEQGATSRDLRVKAGMGTAVNSVVTRATAGQEGPSPMGQETAPGERINKTPLFVTVVVNVKLFLKWLK